MDGAHCAEVRELATRRLCDVRMRLDHLRRIEAALQGLLAHCALADVTLRCPLIEALQWDG